MANGDFHVFISAVTSEFGKVRDAIASDLRARGAIVRVQSDFTHGGDADTLLERLNDYIRDCQAVVCVIGKRSGASPPKAAAARHPKTLPDGIADASYTQWEYFFADYYGRRLYRFIATDDYKPDEDKPVGPDALQDAFVQYVKDQGGQRTPFSNAAELRIAVLREPWPKTLPSDPKPQPKPIVLPYPSLGPLFKGREGFMQQLHESLSRGGQTAITSKALYGLGGIGKTRAAVEYAWAHRDDYSALLFVVAETPEALRRNLASLAATLVPSLDTTDDTVRLQAVLDWLSSNPGWFLILDNVDTPAAMAEVEKLLAGLVDGHVVITSRLSNFAGHIDPLELSVLAPDDAVAFLLERTRKRKRVADDPAKARELASELGELALALEHAGAYIDHLGLTFEQYRQQWLSNREKVMAWFKPEITKYHHEIAVTWQTSVAQLTEPGRRLLERIAWLAPEKVPDFLLDVPTPGAEAEDLHEALANLAAYSLVTRDAEGPYFLVHRLVQDVTRRSLADEAAQRSRSEALNWIDAAFSDGGFSPDPADVRNWPRLEPLAAHARIVTQLSSAAGAPSPTSKLMTLLGAFLSAKALILEAEPLMRRALNIDEASLGPDHPDVAIKLNDLAALLDSTNRRTEAEPLMRRSLMIDEKNYGPHDAAVALRLNNLAALLSQTDRVAEAEPLIRRALEIDERTFGPDHASVARDLNNLGHLLRATDRLAQAEPLLRRALSIDENSLGPNHPRVAIRLSGLAAVLKATDRLVEAEPLMRRALAIDETSFGTDHPGLAVRLNNLAQLLSTTDRLSEAEPLMRRAVAVLANFTHATGHQHPHLDAAFRNYASLLRAMGSSTAEIEIEIEKLKRGQG